MAWLCSGPAAGIAAGTLIALGPRVQVPVAAGVAGASVLASLLSDRNLAAATVFGLCNAAEPLLVARLIKHHFGDDFRLESLRNVLGFSCGCCHRACHLGNGGNGRLYRISQVRRRAVECLAELGRFRRPRYHYGGAIADRLARSAAQTTREVGVGRRYADTYRARACQRARAWLPCTLLVHRPSARALVARIAGRPLPPGLHGCRRAYFGFFRGLDGHLWHG